MTSFSFNKAAMSPSNLFWHLYVSILHLLIAFQSVEGYLTEKPQDAARAVGQSVMFTCNSSWTDPVSWWFYCDNCADKTGKELGTNAVVYLTLSDIIKVSGKPGAGSPDGYRSVLTIDNVTRSHAGTFRCRDGTGSQGSAYLTVTSIMEAVCFTVNPRDQVVVDGDTVVLTASNPSACLRYYYESLDSNPQQRVDLYNGVDFNNRIVDKRFGMIGVGDQGHADLVIRSVKPQDAGRYIVKDITKRSFEVAANLVVFDRLPECEPIWYLLEDDEILLQCSANYTGMLTPRVYFLRQDVTGQALRKTSHGGTILFQRVVKTSDLPGGDIADSQHFEISFELFRCGEPAGHWSWKLDMRGAIELGHTKSTFVMAASLAGVLVILTLVLCFVTVILRQRSRCPHSVVCNGKATGCYTPANSEDCNA